MKVIIYTRVSTMRQAQSGLGLDAQRDACAKWATDNGHEVVGLFTDDGVSGDTPLEECPGLEMALDALPKGGIFLVSNLDRLARDIMKQVIVIKLIEDKKGTLKSAAGEGTDMEGPAGEMFRSLMAIIGKFEKAMASRRTRRALAAARRAGRKTGGDIPFGYTVEEDGKTLKPLAAETEVVELMLELRANGTSFRQIANRLNADGIASRGNGWNKSSVHRIVTREAANVRH